MEFRDCIRINTETKNMRCVQEQKNPRARIMDSLKVLVVKWI